MARTLYKNKETSELLTESEMKREFRQQYDGGDPTNPLGWQEYYTAVNGTLRDLIVSKAEELGWNVHFYQQGEDEIAGFYQYSPAGEDFGFEVYFKTDDDLAREIVEYYDGFDVDEHVEMWLEAKHHGTDRSIPPARILVKDAEDIDKMLEKLADAVILLKDQWF